MVKAIYVPAIGEQFNNVWKRGLTYKGKDGKNYDMKFFTNDSHFQMPISLQSAYYGITGSNKKGKQTYREMVKYPKDKIMVGDSVDKNETIVIRKIGTTFFENKKIGEFVDSYMNNKVISDSGHEFNNINDYEILTINNNMKVCWKKINQVIRHRVNKQSIELETIGGKSIKITSDHSLIQLQDINSFKEVKGDSIIKNDYIISYDKIILSNIDKQRDEIEIIKKKSNNEKIGKFTLNIEELELKIMGYLIGDGHVNPKSYVFGISGIHEKGLLKLWQKFIKKYNLHAGYSPNTFDVSTASKFISSSLIKLGMGGDCYTKQIPDWILNLPLEKLGYFLNGYFSADGSLCINEKNCITQLGVSSVSKKLIQDTKLALDKFGIKYNCGFTPQHIMSMNGKEYISREGYNIVIYDVDSIKLYKKYIGFTNLDKQKKLNSDKLKRYSKLQQANLPCNIVKEFCKFGNQDYITKNRVNHKISKSDIGCFRIKNIRLGQFNNEYVYDLSVEEVERFICSGVLVHNSGGFQIATFKRDGKVCDITPIDSLRWQEANCDVGMNLDIPPNLDGNFTFEEFNKALNESVENFKFFEKERKNYNMRLLNVIHGETLPLISLWHDKVKDFKFDGYAIGMKPPFEPMLQAFAFMFLWEKGEFNKETFKHLHFFGTSGKHVVPTIVYAAHKLLQKDITVTYDSSSYNIGSIYRTYYLPFDVGPNLCWGEKFKKENPHIKELPCKCPVCSNITDIEILNGGDIYAGTLISLHNLYQYWYYNDILNSLVVEKELFLNYLKTINISDKTLKSIEFIDFAIEKGLANAVDKFKNDLIPQELNKSKQVGIWHF